MRKKNNADMNKTKYIYITSREYTNAVYQTQVIDWLNLFLEYNLQFELWHVFHYSKNISKSRREYQTSQINKIKAAYNGCTKPVYLLPNQMTCVNKRLLYWYIKRASKGYEQVVVFSRDNICYEIEYLKQKLDHQLFYYYDLRAAKAEEGLFLMQKKKAYSEKEYCRVAKMAYSEFLRQKIADKVFVVSDALTNYFNIKYNSDKSKFIKYPCLSLASKFYYDTNLRTSMRKELGYENNDNVYVYSGGLSAGWHVPDSFLRLFVAIAKKDENAKLLILSPKITDAFKSFISKLDSLNGRLTLMEGVPNQEVVNYLNAADFGVLLREDNPVNNVAFPSKYAEYIMCGLPTIISEAVYDCATFCINNNCGVVMRNEMMEKMDDFSPLEKNSFNRERIALIGKEKLSKESAVERIISQLKVS